MTRSIRRTWIAILMAVMLLATMAPTGFAQVGSAPLGDDEAIVLLQSYRIVLGDPDGNLRLEDNITRAQAATIFVRAMGASDAAQFLKGANEYSDTVGHWANGEITVAKRLGLMQGDSGRFRPNDNITYVELMAVMLRMVQREPQGPWNPELIMSTAEKLGITPPAYDVMFLAQLPAKRGKVFKSLATTITSIALPSGETLLKKYTDQTPPELTVNPIPARATQDTITVSGEAKGARNVSVNGQEASMSGSKFAANVKLSGGTNELVVEATDYAGNKTSKTYSTVLGGDPVRIEVAGPTQVSQNGTVTITATAYDASGYALPTSSVTATVTGSIGTYTVSNGQFKAGAAGGSGSIKFTAGSVSKVHDLVVTGLASNATTLRIRDVSSVVTVNRSQTVVVEVLDNAGNQISYDTGRRITMTSSPSGLTVTPSSNTNAGTASFTVTPSKEGEYTLTAMSTGLSTDTGTLVAGTSTRIVLTATPGAMSANGTNATLIRATLQDENGNPVVNNSGTDISLTLSSTGAAGSLTNNFLIIPRFTSSSAGYDGQFVAAFEAGAVSISGHMNTTHKYTIQSTSINLTQSIVGVPSRLELIGFSGTKQPGEEIAMTVRVTDKDGNVVPTGSYAFQIQVTSSNTQDPIVNGLPDDVNLTLGVGSLSPAYGGGTAAVVGRTTNGVASVKLSYSKSGKLKLKPVGLAGTQTAFDNNGDSAAASSTSGWTVTEREFVYDDIVGGTENIELEWYLDGLKMDHQPMGILPANGTSTAKLRAYLVDANGGRRPTGSGQMTVAKVGTGSKSTSSTATVTAGAAEFTIISTTTANTDTYTVTYGAFNGTTTMQTKTAKAPQPQIWSLYGESGNPFRVEISDKYMEILLSPVPGANGIVKVYSVSNNRLVYTSKVMSLDGSPSVHVPKIADPLQPLLTPGLVAGADRYKITVNTGFGDSLASDPYPSSSANPVVVARATTIDISAVRYDAKTQSLKVTASGVSTASGGMINSEKLTLRKTGVGGTVLPLSGVTCIPSSSGFTCDLTGYGLTASAHSGAWILDTEDGWFTRTSTGDSASKDVNTENNFVTPFALITSAAVDFASGKVTLYGVNLNTGTIYLSKLLINNNPSMALGTGTVRPTSSTDVTITLPTATANLVRNLTGSILLNGGEGWLKDTASNENAALDIPAAVLASVNVTRASYDKTTDILTIFGSGLSGGTVDVTKLVIRNRSNGLVLRLVAGDFIQNLVAGKIDGDTVQIKLSLASQGTLEAAGNDANVFLSSDEPDTIGGTGWFEDALNRLGTSIRGRTYLLNW